MIDNIVVGFCYQHLLGRGPWEVGYVKSHNDSNIFIAFARERGNGLLFYQAQSVSLDHKLLIVCTKTNTQQEAIAFISAIYKMGKTVTPWQTRVNQLSYRYEFVKSFLPERNLYLL